MRILIIEDHEKLANSIKKSLEYEGYAVDVVYDGVEGLRRIELAPDNFDLIILDIMLPRMNGFDLCKEIRQKNIMIPVLMLTAKDSLDDKINGLDAGADDYLVKPFEIDELVARIRALLRRPQEIIEEELEGKGIKLNTAKHTVEKIGKNIKLTPKEFAIVELFLRNKNHVLSRDMIITHVWSFEYDSFSNIVDVNIKNIRRKLQNKNENIFETIHGVGYRFNEK